MSIYPNVTKEDLNNLSKLAEQQKTQRAIKIKNRILKQTHDIKLAESLSPITKKFDTINESTKKLAETPKKSDVEDGNSQTPAIENIIGTQSLRDTLALMKRSKIFLNQKKNQMEMYFGMIYLLNELAKIELVLKIKNLI